LSKKELESAYWSVMCEVIADDSDDKRMAIKETYESFALNSDSTFDLFDTVKRTVWPSESTSHVVVLAAQLSDLFEGEDGEEGEDDEDDEDDEDE
jgi:hypothetical protein